MKNNIIESLLLLQLVSVCIGVNPCVDYVSIYMADGLRSSDFDSRNSEVSICDAYLDTETWYRFEHDAGNRLIDKPVDPWYCGTQAPIWLNGTHPTDMSELTAGVCATFTSENICGWSGTVRIRLCNESGREYFVYLLDVPPGCPLAYCVDAASRKQCIPPEVWLEDEFRCGVSETTTPHSTVPLTTLTTLARTSSPSTERQSSTTTLSTSTEPPNSGWSKWGPWSVCSKPCDYGFQSRRRTCDQLPCEGPANTYRLCNEYNCQSLQEEKTRGIGLFFECPESKEDLMLTVVLNQPKIHNIIRKNINDICSQNVSMCCGWRYNGISSLDPEFVQSSDIYPAQGSLEPKAENTVYYQIIAIVNENFDRAICKGHSQRNYPRHLKSSPNFLSFDVMMIATVKSVDNIFQETGLILRAYVDPATMTENNNVDDDDDDYANDEVSCPSITCVLPIVLCISIVFAAAVIGGFCIAKNKLKPRTEPVASSTEPPQYYDVLSTDMRYKIPGSLFLQSVNLKGLPYNATDVSHKESDQEPVDFQKIALDV